MKVVYTPAHLLHDPKTEIEKGTVHSPFEHIGRGEVIREVLSADSRFEMLSPSEWGTDVINAVHNPGLNRFFKDNYLSLATNFSQELKNDVWGQFGESLFSSDDEICKIESFLLSQLCENHTLFNIEISLTLLENRNEQLSISDIAKKVGLKLKTFQRHFQKHMGCSPVEYRRIYRFRSSLANKLNNTQLKNLTEITYEEGYYDQSYLIKEFRKITNHNPKDFFKSASKVDGDKIIWEIK